MPPPPPTPAVAGFKEWISDPQTQQKIANGITNPGQPLLPTNVPAASPMAPSAQLGSGVPLDPSASKINLMPPQRDTSWLTPPTAGTAEGNTATSRAFPNSPAGASGLLPKLAAAGATAPTPDASTPWNPAQTQIPPTIASPQPWALDPARIPQNSSAPALPTQSMISPPPSLGSSGVQPANITAAPGLPTTAPTPTQAYQTNMRLDQAANPSDYQAPGLVGQGWKGLLRFGVPAALMSAASGLSDLGRGDPTAGIKLLGQQVARDEAVPATNAAQYDRRNVQPLRDAVASQQAAANLAHTQAETTDIELSLNRQPRATG